MSSLSPWTNLKITFPQRYRSKAGRQLGQAVPGNHLNRNSLISIVFWFSAQKVRPDPVFGPPRLYLGHKAGRGPDVEGAVDFDLLAEGDEVDAEFDESFVGEVAADRNRRAWLRAT